MSAGKECDLSDGSSDSEEQLLNQICDKELPFEYRVNLLKPYRKKVLPRVVEKIEHDPRCKLINKHRNLYYEQFENDNKK